MCVCAERMQLLEDVYLLLLQIHWSITVFSEFIAHKPLEMV